MIANSGIMFLIITITTFAIPGTLALISQIPMEGLTIASAIGLLLVFLSAFIGLRIILDLISIVDLASDFLMTHIPSLKANKRISIVRALKEILAVLIMSITATIAGPILLFVPKVGWLLQLLVSVGLAIPAVILLYDSGRTLYAIFQSAIELFIDSLAKQL
jgi:hypothetical protein